MSKYENFGIEDFLRDEYFLEWVLKPTVDHKLFWEQWLMDNPEKKEELSNAARVIRSIYLKPLDRELSSQELNEIACHFISQTTSVIELKKNTFSRLRWIGIAAAILVPVMVGSIFSGSYFSTPEIVPASLWIHTVNQHNGSKLVALSDGSLVILKAHSHLIYPKVFEGGKRVVTLRGEAFFEVHKDAKRPFYVYTGPVVTKVLGTSFTVSSFPGKRKFAVLVNTGKVEVFQRQKGKSLEGSPSIVLLPDQQAVWNKQRTGLERGAVETSLLLSAGTSKKTFSFVNTPVPVIIARLEKAYSVRIQYDSSQYSLSRVTASLSNLPLEGKIKALSKAVNGSYRITDTGFIIN